METFKARGIIIKEMPVGESDKIVTILCKEIGKMSVFSRGARKPKSKLLAGTQLFSYSDFIIRRKGEYLYVDQIDLIENFYSICQDFDKMCYGSYFCEILNKVILENESCDNILHLMLKSLTVLKKGTIRAELVARIFELKLLDYEGYRPEIRNCISCDSAISVGFFTAEGVACKACYEGQKVVAKSLLVSETTLYTMEYIFLADIKSLFAFEVSDIVLVELKKVSRIYMMYNYEYNFKSLELVEG